jgi:hypothetical protein
VEKNLDRYRSMYPTFPAFPTFPSHPATTGSAPSPAGPQLAVLPNTCDYYHQLARHADDNAKHDFAAVCQQYNIKLKSLRPEQAREVNDWLYAVIVYYILTTAKTTKKDATANTYLVDLAAGDFVPYRAKITPPLKMKMSEQPAPDGAWTLHMQMDRITAKKLRGIIVGLMLDVLPMA